MATSAYLSSATPGAGAARRAGTDANVIEMGHPTPASAYASVMNRAARDVAARGRVERVPDAEPEELVPGGVELDLVDPLAEAVMRAEDRRMLVREPPELERLAAAEPPERRALLVVGVPSFAPKRLDERPVLGEHVVALERRRLIRGEVCARRHQIVLNCSNGWRQALQ